MQPVAPSSTQPIDEIECGGTAVDTVLQPKPGPAAAAQGLAITRDVSSAPRARAANKHQIKSQQRAPNALLQSFATRRAPSDVHDGVVEADQQHESTQTQGRSGQ